MAVSAFQKLVNKLFQQFIRQWGREPQTPKEWMDLQNEAVRYFNRTKGVPPGPAKPPFQGWKPKVIPGGKGIESLLKSGDVKKGVAPKTKLSTLEGKKTKQDEFINKEQWIAKKKAENKAAIERFKEKTQKKTVEDLRDEGDWDPSGMASGGIARVGMMIGGFTKAQVLIQMMKNTLKGSKDAYVKKTFPNFIKELQKNPELALDPNVWKQFTTGLPKNQRLVVHSDDSVDFFTQSKFGPHNIEKTLEFQKKHNLSRDQANKILQMEPEDRVLEMKRLETIRNRTKQASGGIAGELHLHRPGYSKGKVVTEGLEWLAKLLKGGKKKPKADVVKPFKFPDELEMDKWKKQTLEDMLKSKTRLEDFDIKGKPHADGGLAYMLGEPTYMRLAGGGDVGHGPWTTGQTPPGPQTQPDMPQPQVMGTPDPMKAPRLPSVAPRNMDPQYMQQQMMQQAMMQQGIPQGIPRVGMMYGGDPGFAFEYGGSWADWHDQHRNAMPIEDYIQTKLPKERLPFRQNFADGGMTRRMFLKLMGGLSALPFVGKGVQKAAPKAIKEVTETITRNADGIPDYAFDLIEVVKAKGTKEIMEGIYKRNPPSTKYTYKDVEVIEDGLGNTSVRKPQTKTGSWHDEAADDVIVDDYVDREVGFEIRKGEDIVKDEGMETQKVIKGADEYDESTAYMQGDPEGGMDVSDIVEKIEVEDHLDLKKIADEIGDVYYEDVNITGKLKRPKKASGGLAHLLGE